MSPRFPRISEPSLNIFVRMHEERTTCPLTGWPWRELGTKGSLSADFIECSVTVDDRDVVMNLQKADWESSPVVRQSQPLLRTILRTGNWPFDEHQVISEDMLGELVSNPKIPKSPDGTLRLLFAMLHDKQEKRGDWVESFDWVQTEAFLKPLYLENLEEVGVYFREIESLGLINLKENHPANDNGIGLPLEYRLTYKGLKRYREMQEDGPASGIVSLQCPSGTVLISR